MHASNQYHNYGHEDALHEVHELLKEQQAVLEGAVVHPANLIVLVQHYEWVSVQEYVNEEVYDEHACYCYEEGFKTAGSTAFVQLEVIHYTVSEDAKAHR